MRTLQQIALGRQGLLVPVQGLGCMGMTPIAGHDVYGNASEAEAIATIHRSLELGGNFLDTADLYGPLLNERLVAKAIKGNRDKYIIATKFGYEIDDQEQLTWKMNGRPDYVRKAVERSLKNLGIDCIDLYYLHRLDFGTPIEDTVGAMAELVKEGKIKYLGLSEVSSATIRRAHAVFPITAVQSEYSLFERGVEETGILATLEELGIGFVAYSPLSRGFLNGAIKSPDDFAEDDFRRSIPRFMAANFERITQLLEKIGQLAEARGITAAQLALAWVMAKGVVAIPGTKRVRYVEENIAAAEVLLSAGEMQQLEEIVPLGLSTGERYDAANMLSIDQ